jgi:acetyl-CoA acetyltransferase
MRDVAIIAFADVDYPRSEDDEVELISGVIARAMAASGITKKQIGFTVSGSCDYLGGRPFSFVTALDAVGAWPPISESHVEMDGAWALYEAWVRLQHGDIDAALVYAFGRTSQGDLPNVLATQLDPYYLAPLWPDATSLAALQARAMIDAGRCSEKEMAEVARARRRSAAARAATKDAGVKDVGVDDLLAAPYVAAPLRSHDCAPNSDGAAAVVLAAGDLARRVCQRPAWIRGIDHRIEAHSLGVRDLTRSASTELAARKAGAPGRRFDVAEIHAPYSHQDILISRALGLGEDVAVNSSGGAFGANAYIVTGLARIGTAASRILDGTAGTAVAHATSGPCLQQNLVCVLGGER